MLIINSEVTSETGERLRQFLPFDLKEKKIVLNIGNSSFNETNYKDWQIINHSESIKNAVNKKRMFELFKENNISCLDYIDLKKLSGKIKGIFLLLCGNELVFRGDRLKVSKNFKDLFKYDYATKREKKLEYRAIVFRDKIIRMMVKLPYNKSFKLKQENCRFLDIDINKIEEKEKNNIINSVKCLGLDLAGVDVLVNENKWLVLETNSGCAMSPRSCKLLYKELDFNIFNYLDKL